MAYSLTNRLLDSLPAQDKTRLVSLLEPVALPLRTNLYEVGKAPKYVHFLTSGLASTVAAMSHGNGVEVGLTGREGLPESLHLLGPERGDTSCFMQLGGTALRMDFKRFEGEFLQPPTHRLVLRYIQHEALVTGQLAACNRLHEVGERLARWLLMVCDRTGDLKIELSQEFLGEMLGARRSSVTVAAGELQRSGLIESHRRIIRILDRERLEEAACECYPIIQRLFTNLYR